MWTISQHSRYRRGMQLKQHAVANELGRDISEHLPDPATLKGLPKLNNFHKAIWDQASPYLRTRRNDIHSLFAFGIASALLEFHPQADPEVVLPAILLHDTGWSCVPENEVLEGIAPGGGRRELVLLHEKEGARIGREILTSLNHPAKLIDEIVEIIDGHDSRRETLSINDSIVKDADKIWRVTPWGISVIMDWFGLERSQAVQLCAARVHGHLFTDEGAAMAMAFTSLESLAATPEVHAVF